MDFKDTSTKLLKLSIIHGEVSDSHLNKIVSDQLRFKDAFGNRLLVDVSIIGASHSVRVSSETNGEVFFQEVLANEVMELDNVKKNASIYVFNHEDMVKPEDIVLSEKENGYGISYNIFTEEMSIAKLQENKNFIDRTLRHQRGVKKSGDVLMRYKFPVEGDIDHEIEPHTLIEVWCSPIKDRVHVASYHVYPNEDKAFVSYSEIITSKKIILGKGMTIINKGVLVEELVNAGIERSKALEIIAKAEPTEFKNIDEAREMIGDMLETFDEMVTHASNKAKNVIDSFDKDSVIDSVQKGLNGLLDALKQKKE